MASDNFDIDWDDDDMFGGDIDFDMDFDMDPHKGKSFIGSFGRGFLSGLVHESVGTGENRFRTLRTILPSTFSTALDKASFISDRMGDLAREFKEENAESAKSLQNIAGHLNKKMGEKLPGFVQNGLNNFSNKDFSSWEKLDEDSGGFKAKIDSTSEDDIDSALRLAETNQSSMFASLGESLNSMTAVATSALQSSIGAGNRQLVNIEGAMRDMLNYQRNVDARIQQAQLTVMTRAYVQDAKYYKFMEAGIHAEVAELKRIVKNSGMSDVQKTTTYMASKDYIRKSIFNTVGKRLGGLSGTLRDKFSKENRTEAYGVFGDLFGQISDGLDMGEGSMSKGMIGDILGKMVAGLAIEKLPGFFAYGPGKKVVDRMMKAYPEQGKYIKEQVAKLSDIGNVVSYASTSGAGMLNYMAENYEAMDEMKFADYDEYVDSLPAGKKPLPKKVWTALNATGNRGKEAINKMMANVTKSRGTQYTIKRRNVKDLNQPGIWKEINNVTLNEVLPGLLTKNNQLLEQIATGKDSVEAVSYNYMRGEFQTDSQKRIAVKADLMAHGEFQRYASAALSLVDSVDPDKLISPATRKAFALQVAKDIDAEMGFNPYYYLGDIKGMSPGAQKEVHAALMRHFGISTQDVSEYKGADSFQRMKKMSVMGTAEGRENLNRVSASAANIKQNFPNVAERIDMLRATGNEQLLRDMGVIYTDEEGIDKINMQAFHDRIGMYMDDPNNPELRGISPNKGGKSGPTKGKMGGGKLGGLRGGPSINPNEELNSTLTTLNERLASLGERQSNSSESANTSTVNFDSVSGEISDIKESNRGILVSTTAIEEALNKLTEMAMQGKLFTGGAEKASDENREEQAKRKIFGSIKDYIPKGLGNLTSGMSSGLDWIMKRNPMVLGGILGSVGAAAAGGSPLVSAGLAGAGLLGGYLVDRFKRGGSEDQAVGDEPSDDEDIIDENGEPLLKSALLKAGQYLDATKRTVIKSWSDIRGPIYNAATKSIIGAKELAGKIFGPDGRAVALNGLRYLRDKAVAGYNLLNPLGRIKSIIESGKELIYQQDVYVKGNKEPSLRATGFKTGEYYVRDESGKFKPIKGWNEINGAVYDEQGNQLVSEAEYQSGLVTSTGLAVRNMGSGIASFAGGAAGLGKSGINAILGKFGYSNGGTAPAGSAASVGAGYNGVEVRLDKIYKMLSQHFGIPMDDTVMGAMSGGGSTGGVDDSGLRLNSLAWKEKEKEKEEKHKVNEAIIKISENTEGLGGPSDEKGEKKGFWGTIKGLLGGLGAFGMKLIKNPIGTIGSMVFGSLLKSTGRLAKIGTALFSGVLGMASPVYKLLKWGFGKLAMGLAGKALGRGARAGLDDFGDGPEQRGQSAKRKAPGRKGGRRGRGLGRVGKLLTGGALAMGGAAAINSLTGYSDEDFETGTEDIEAGERDESTGRYNTWSDKGMEALTDYLPQGMLAKSLVQGVLGPERYKEWDNKGLFWTSDGSFFTDRRERDAAQAVLDGKTPVGVAGAGSTGIDKDAKLTTQKKIRLAMYGVKEPNSNLARRVLALENQLYQYVAIRNGSASLKPETPTDKIISDFANSSMGKGGDVDAVRVWFNGRFKPVFMLFNVAISIANMGDIVEFDKATSYDVVQVVERVQTAVASQAQPPYNIDVRIDNESGLMPAEMTRAVIAMLFEDLKKEIKAPPKESDVESIATTDEIKDKVNTAVEGKGPSNDLPYMAASDKMGALAAQASQQAIESKFKQPSDVTTIDISDMLPGEKNPMDPFTMVRLAVYGNIDNISWRVEAVLRLERYMENFIMVTGDDAKFTGKSNQVLDLFKASFRLDNDVAKNNWSLWFRDRFLPTLMEYSKLLYKQRTGIPSSVWKTLSATNRAVIARKLTSLIVSVDDKQMPVWDIEASPFPNSKSGKWADRADKYLAILDSKAQEARLKDPELEEAKSQAQAPTSMDITQQGQAARAQRTQDAMASVYRTGATGSNASGPMGGMGSGSGYGANSAGGYFPNATMSAPGGGAGSAGAFMGQANNNFSPEFIKQAGEDKGIKMSLSQGEQLMLNHLVKAGFKDNKTLALALAMAKKETGGYSSTVENTNWSAPTLLKYFKNIPDAATAQKVAAMSPAERAMYVYGRAPKGPSLGNQKPEDGFTYRGRGLFQLTGKANYEAFKKASGIDVVSNPRIVSEDPNVMAESAVWFLKNNKAMQSIAKTGDFDTAVRGINGGNAVPATDERRQFYNDYLNRLRSGDLTIAGGSDSPDAAAGDQKTMADGGIPDQTPEGADKNVPQDKATGTNNPNSTAVNPGDTASLIKSVEAGNKPSNAGNTSSANASPLSQTPSAPSSSVAAPVAPPTTSGGGTTGSQGSSAGTSTPVMDTSTVAKAPPKQSPAKDVSTQNSNTPMPPLTVDNTNVVGALAGVSKILEQIRDKLPEKDSLPHVKV